MKKANIIITAVLAICSIFLLGLWFYLGFNKIDNPLDLVISIVWWVVIAAVIAAIANAESKRQRAIRTVFVAPGSIFNSEAGLTAFEGSAADAIQQTLKGLEYGFTKQELPEGAANMFDYAVKSATFKCDEQTQQWEGEVVTLKTGEIRSFDSEGALRAILGA